MQKMGVIQNVSYKGDLLVKAVFAPRVGQEVLDGRKTSLGRVRRVFGPVAAPYVTVEPQGEPSLGLLGSDVWVDVKG